jgi:peroxiredoxin
LNGKQFAALLTLVAVLTGGLLYLWDRARRWGPHSRSADIVAAAPVRPGEESPVAIGKPLPGIALRTTDGETLRLSDARGKVVVLLVQGAVCPCSEAYIPRVNAIAARYEPKGVEVWGFNPNVTETEEQTKAYTVKHNLAFPLAYDAGGKVADQLGAACTTEVWLVDREGVLRYHGRIDDDIYHPEKVKHTDLVNAIDAVLEGKPVPVAETHAYACTISRKQES